MNQGAPGSRQRVDVARTGSYQRHPVVREEIGFLKLILLAGAFLLVLSFCVALFFWR